MADTLRDALLDEIKDLYNAEKQLTKALPKMVKHATDGGLRAALQSHLAETEGHVGRLEQIFGLLDEKVRGKHCAGMAGIIEEGKAQALGLDDVTALLRETLEEEKAADQKLSTLADGAITSEAVSAARTKGASKASAKPAKSGGR